MFIDPSQDPRGDGPPGVAGERETLTGFLRWQRETLELKCSGLSAGELARRAVEPSTMSLLGMIRHMAEVERGWFRRTLAGRDAPPLFYDRETNPDGDWDDAVASPSLVSEAWAAWRDEVAFAERFAGEAPDLDVTGRQRLGEVVSLRWVLVHMIEEYARHNGHADLLRERIDGRLGQLPRGRLARSALCPLPASTNPGA
jgi:uncharacterized damage-inducible protein DinB